MNKEVILTGIRSNAELHLGNYLGAIKPMTELQRQLRGQYQLNMFVPDLHSFTTETDHAKLYQQTVSNVACYVAAGLDLKNPDTYVYRQSRIPAHSELSWILSCFTYFGELSRMTQFKDKSQDGDDSITAGLFNYPVLMAADILLYGAKWVPVGEDQRQHLELTRDLAIRMNAKFGPIFAVPEPWEKQLEFGGRGSGSRIRSLRHPDKKMSKSVDDPAGTIMLSDEPDEAYKKVLAATTDSVGRIGYDWQSQPGISNLLQIYGLLLDKSIDESVAQWQGHQSYDVFKTAVASEVRDCLRDFQTRLKSVNKGSLLEKLGADEAAMTKVADKLLGQVQQAVGLSAS